MLRFNLALLALFRPTAVLALVGQEPPNTVWFYSGDGNSCENAWNWDDSSEAYNMNKRGQHNCVDDQPVASESERRNFIWVPNSYDGKPRSYCLLKDSDRYCSSSKHGCTGYEMQDIFLYDNSEGCIPLEFANGEAFGSFKFVMDKNCTQWAWDCQYQ